MWTAGMIGRTVAAIAVTGLVAFPTVGAQSPSTISNWRSQGATPEGDVVGPGNFIHMSADLERTTAFYATLLGVQANDEAMNYPYHPEFKANEPTATMYNTRGSKFRNTTFNVPNSNLGLEFFEWEGNRSPSVNARVFDPGAPMMVLQVRHIEAGIDAVKTHGGSFVTPNGEPVRFGNRRVLIVRDPDGYFVELINLDNPPPAPEPGNPIGATFRYTAVDANRTAHFFEAAFGFTVNEARDLTDDPVLGKAMGLGALMQRWAGSTVPGSTLGVQFAEYKLQGKKVEQGLPRIGTSMLRLRVRDFDASLAKAKAAGATVAPGNDPPLTLGNGLRMAVVVIPDGLLLQLAEAPK